MECFDEEAPQLDHVSHFCGYFTIQVVVTDVERPTAGELPDGCWDRPSELVLGQVKVCNQSKVSDLRMNGTRNTVVEQVERFQRCQFSDFSGQRQSHLMINNNQAFQPIQTKLEQSLCVGSFR